MAAYERRKGAGARELGETWNRERDAGETGRQVCHVSILGVAARLHGRASVGRGVHTPFDAFKVELDG